MVLNNGPLYYACIGSRETPKNIMKEMEKIGQGIANSGGIARSGHARGADQAFESGAGKNCESYLPWKGFEKEVPVLGKEIIVRARGDLDDMVWQYHPVPENLSYGAFALMRRNACQVLGLDLNSPSLAVICWTLNGGYMGGTSQAMRIADAYNIPIINMWQKEFDTAEKVLKKLGLS